MRRAAVGVAPRGDALQPCLLACMCALCVGTSLLLPPGPPRTRTPPLQEWRDANCLPDPRTTLQSADRRFSGGAMDIMTA